MLQKNFQIEAISIENGAVRDYRNSFHAVEQRNHTFQIWISLHGIRKLKKEFENKERMTIAAKNRKS